MTEIILGLPKETKKELFYNYKKNTIRAVGFVPFNNKDIHLYGFDNNFKLWVNILIHENFHIILFNNNIDDVYHHRIISKLNMPYKISLENGK